MIFWPLLDLWMISCIDRSREKDYNVRKGTRGRYKRIEEELTMKKALCLLVCLLMLVVSCALAETAEEVLK